MMTGSPATGATSEQCRFPWFTASAGASLLIFALIGCGAGNLNSRQHYVSFTDQFHVSLDSAGLHYFSDGQYGPYRGSIIGLSGDPNSPKVTAFNLPCYFRHFRWPNGQRMWTLTVPLPLVLLPFTFLPAIWLIQEIRRSRMTPKISRSSPP